MKVEFASMPLMKCGQFGVVKFVPIPASKGCGIENGEASMADEDSVVDMEREGAVRSFVVDCMYSVVSNLYMLGVFAVIVWRRVMTHIRSSGDGCLKKSAIDVLDVGSGNLCGKKSKWLLWFYIAYVACYRVFEIVQILFVVVWPNHSSKRYKRACLTKYSYGYKHISFSASCLFDWLLPRTWSWSSM